MERIAVLIATYNGEKYIRELIDSLLSQSVHDFHIYIHDDGSLDETIRIIKDYIHTNPSKIDLLDYPSTGGSKFNYMFLLRNVQADYYMFCDQDDVWKQDKVEKRVKLMKQVEGNGKRPSLCFTDLEVVDSELKTISKSYLELKRRNPYNTDLCSLLRTNVAAGCTMIFNSSLRDIAIRCSDVNHISMHDAWLIICASVFGNIGYLGETTILYRQHGGNVIGAKNNTKHWIEEKAKGIIGGTQIQKSREGINFKKRMCEEILRISALQGEQIPDNNKTKLINICSRNKMKRIKSFISYGMLPIKPSQIWKITIV